MMICKTIPGPRDYDFMIFFFLHRPCHQVPAVRSGQVGASGPLETDPDNGYVRSDWRLPGLHQT